MILPLDGRGSISFPMQGCCVRRMLNDFLELEISTRCGCRSSPILDIDMGTRSNAHADVFERKSDDDSSTKRNCKGEVQGSP